jgi:large subunit ribosomal protein L31
MKKDIHPAYQSVKATCSCGNSVTIRSTLQKDLHLDVCSECHPFFTGKQKTLSASGRVDRFQRMYKKSAAKDNAAKDA